MYKKIVIPLILALIMPLAFSNVAYAANKPDTSAIIRNVGTITNVDIAGGFFKFVTVKGQHLTIHVDSSTVYRGGVSGLAGLTPSMYVNVQARKQPNGSYLGVVVNVLKQHVSVKIAGQITDVKATSFTILGSDAKTYTFGVTSKTTFSGFGVASISDLTVGMKVRTTYEDMGNGILRAMNVVVLRLHTIVIGKVTAKDTTSFTILGSDGINYTFQVTSKTTFSGNSVTSFSKLKVGMSVKVGYATLTDGTLRAMTVVVRAK